MKIQTKQKLNIQNFLTGMKNTIKTSIMAIMVMLAGSQSAFASNIVLSVSPLSATNTVSTVFNISVQVDPMGNSFDVVKGTVVFDKLSCQSITLTSGTLAIVTPTCSAPNFVIGIKGGTSVFQNLFSVSVKGNGVGQSNIIFTGVKLIKAGVDVAFSTQGGVYNMVTVAQIETPIIPVSTSTTPVESTETNVTIPDAGLQVPSGVGEFNPSENNEIKVIEKTSSSSMSTIKKETNGLVATAIEGLSSISNKSEIVFIFMIVLAVVAGLIFYNRRNNKNTPNRPNPTETF